MSDRGRSAPPQPVSSALGDILDLLGLVWAVDHALQRRSRAMAAKLGITGPQRPLVRIIGRFPNIPAKQWLGQTKMGALSSFGAALVALVLARLLRVGRFQAWANLRAAR